MPRYVKIGGSGLTNVQVGPNNGATGDVFLLTDDEYEAIPAANLDGNPLIDLGEDQQGATVMSIPIDFASMPVGAGDVVTNVPLQGRGTITQVVLVVTVAGTGTGATKALNLEIGTTNVTGGVVTPTLAGTATVGTVVAGTAITANNTFADGDTLSVECNAGTVFTAGSGVLLITVE